jgi:flagellar hook-length control protein FliK
LGKRSRGPQNSDAEKVALLLYFVDGGEIAFALVNTATRYLSSISNVGNSNGPSASVDIAIEALNLALAAGRRQLKGTRLAVDNTSAKQSATQSHKKLTQLDRQRFGKQQLQRRALAPTNPRKMLQLAISDTKQKLNSLRQSAATTSNLADGSAVIAPRSKKRKASPIDV